MPANQLLPVWNVTRERQDISEKLYMRFNISGQTVSFLAIVNTTSGYFELPNYMNGQSPGQLLKVDPETLCSSSLSCQFSDVHVEPGMRALTRSAVNESSVVTQVGTAATSEELRQIVNKGPLLAMAVALFGSGSYIDLLQANWNSLVAANRINTYTEDENCIGLIPVGFLVGSPLDRTLNDKALNHCIYNGSDPMGQLDTWAFWFGYYKKNDLFVSRADTFTAMAFLANEIWLTYYDESVVVQYDLGADHQFPTMSLAGMVVISVLLAVYLSCLLTMTFYSCKTGLWTAQLDAFAMLRFGSALSDKVPLVLSRNNDKIEALDELPGWIGDGSPHSHTGALTVGAESRLREKRKFTSYEFELPPRIEPALDRTGNRNDFHVVWYAEDE